MGANAPVARNAHPPALRHAGAARPHSSSRAAAVFHTRPASRGSRYFRPIPHIARGRRWSSPCTAAAVDRADSERDRLLRTPDDEELCDAIVGYLRDHPNAADTLEGIAEWWLPRHQLRIDVERLARMLRRLADRDVLEALGMGGGTRYRLKARPVDE